MVDFVNGAGQLDSRVDDAVFMLEERRQAADAEVAVFVDGGSDDCAAMFLIPGAVIGSAAEQRYANGCTADDHARPTPAASGRPAKNSGAWARLSGVPMSKKRPSAR